MEEWIKTRNIVINWKYRLVIRPILFRFNPEDVHDWFVSIGHYLGATTLSRWLTKLCLYYKNSSLQQKILGIKFENPIGLAAGFDKNGQMINIMPSVGFGFTEIGSITARPCTGNPKPRLWRLPKSKSLIVYYGLKNEGVEKVCQRLDIAQPGIAQPTIPLGISIAKTNDEKTVNNDDAIADYFFTYKTLINKNIGDYYTINISCPNTFGGEPFTEIEQLEKLLATLHTFNNNKPLFLKMPPDISNKQLDDIIDVAQKYNIAGFVCTNLTKDRTLPNFQNLIKDDLPTNKGGLSGKVLENLANEQISYIYSKIRHLPRSQQPVIIGCGGVSSAEDAYAKIKAGASLVQLITGMIFEGPQLISEINQGLVRLLQKDGYKNIGEAIGRDAPSSKLDFINQK